MILEPLHCPTCNGMEVNQEPRCKQTGYGQPKPTQDYTYAPRGGEFTRDWIKHGTSAAGKQRYLPHTCRDYNRLNQRKPAPLNR